MLVISIAHNSSSDIVPTAKVEDDIKYSSVHAVCAFLLFGLLCVRKVMAIVIETVPKVF